MVKLTKSRVRAAESAKNEIKEKIEIKSLRRGECLTFVGDEHILINIEANEFEKEIIEK